MLHDFSADFSKYKDTSFINLNNGTLGLCPHQVIEQQKIEIEAFEKNTSLSLGQSWSRLWQIQEQLSLFLGTQTKDIFLRPNVTLALNEIIMGLPLAQDSEILSTGFEYGAILNILKYKSAKEGHSLRLIDLDFIYEDISADHFVEKIIELTNEKTRVFLISHIFTGNGIEVPIAKLGQALRKKDILLIVDGAHAPGLINLDFQNDFDDVDFYAGNLHKWFMGPKGTAFGWVHPRHQEQTMPLYGSWTTSDNTPPVIDAFKRQGNFAERMLWSHSQSFPSYFALQTCLDFWSHYGKDLIFSEIQKRMKYLESTLRDRGIQPIKATTEKLSARLLCYKIENFSKIAFEDLFVKNSSPRLQVGLPRLPGCPILRLTPHIHNTQSELDLARDILVASQGSF